MTFAKVNLKLYGSHNENHKYTCTTHPPSHDGIADYLQHIVPLDDSPQLEGLPVPHVRRQHHLDEEKVCGDEPHHRHR